MDRKIRVTVPDKFQADIDFRYTSANKGRAVITPYYVYDTQDEDGVITWNFSKSSYEDEVDFSHGNLGTVEAVKEFDRSFAAQHFKSTKEFNASKSELTLLDDGYPARYIVHNLDEPIGIFEINGKFPEAEKTIRYMSIRKLRDDGSLKGSGFDSNAVLLKRFKEEYLEAEWMYGGGACRIDFSEVSW